jgi:hypothetical protein
VGLPATLRLRSGALLSLPAPLAAVLQQSAAAALAAPDPAIP